MKKSLAVLGYDTINIGDDIQSFVSSCIFKPKYAVIRDNYDIVYNLQTGKKINLQEPITLVMNGWFMHDPNRKYTNKNVKFPYQNTLIEPYYVSISLNIDEMYSEKNIAHFKQYEPILTRDRASSTKLQKKGVNAIFIGCMTQRLKPDMLGYSGPINRDLIIYVDEKVPKDEKRPHIIISHIDKNLTRLNPAKRMEKAHNLLIFYFTRAKKIYTTRIHCYLPCKALGLDVEYRGSVEDRTRDLV